MSQEKKICTITRKQLVQELFNAIQQSTEKRSELGLGTLDFVLKTLITVIIESLEQGNQIVLKGFGTFGVKVHKSRICRNPRTGELLEKVSKEHRKAYFRPSDELRFALEVEISQNQLPKISVDTMGLTAIEKGKDNATKETAQPAECSNASSSVPA